MFRKPNSGKKNTSLSQFGLLDVPNLDDDDEPMDSDDDLDLEAELAAISGETKKHHPRKPAPVSSSNLDALVAESLKDVPSDDEGSVDEDDPELLSELQSLALEDGPSPPPRSSRPAPPPPSLSNDSSTVSLLRDRILNYIAAERQAKESGEGMRARRFGRGLKTLNDLLKQAQSGKQVNDLDIPPPVSLTKKDPPSPAKEATETPEPQTDPVEPQTVPVEPQTEPAVPQTEAVEPEPPCAPEPVDPPPPPPRIESAVDPDKREGLQTILRCKEQFKSAALASKQCGDKVLALEYLKVTKQLDAVVQAYLAGQEMDLSELPTPEAIATEHRGRKEEGATQHAAEPSPPVAPAPSVSAGGLVTGATLAEALRLRLAAFQQQEAKAKEEGNSSKARRMGRIVKQYQDAIRLHAAGKPVPADELPTPAGHGPLPTDSASAPPRAAAAPSPRPSPAAPPRASRHDKQLAFLLHRQKEFREAALHAKKTGNIEQAKEYLRAAKGFDAVIEAARGGLAVDLTSLPLPPDDRTKIEQTFDVVSAEDCTPPDVVSPVTSSDCDEDALTKLSQQLTAQLKICLVNRDHYREMGNIAEMNRFEHLAMKVKQDLDVVVVAKSLGQITPKFHYEQKQFSVVQCNTDLNENDLELTIVRGIAFNVPNPKEIDTYVKFEFPYPQDAPVSDRTQLIKDTNSPVYNAAFTLAIQRSARPCQRVFKRHGIKLEVYSRGGWFSADRLIGTAVVKLAPLETQVTIHEALPLMDGRRPAGGSLEVRLRVRTPILQQHFENSTHRWLVIDN